MHLCGRTDRHWIHSIIIRLWRKKHRSEVVVTGFCRWRTKRRTWEDGRKCSRSLCSFPLASSYSFLDGALKYSTFLWHVQTGGGALIMSDVHEQRDPSGLANCGGGRVGKYGLVDATPKWHALPWTCHSRDQSHIKTKIFAFSQMI